MIRLLRLLVLPCMLLLAAGGALATPQPVDPRPHSSLDPNFGIKDPHTCGAHCIKVTSLTFSFTVPASGSGQIEFQNDTGKTMTSLTLDLFADPGVTLSDVHCSVGAFFSSCDIAQLTDSSDTGETEFQFHLFGVDPPRHGECKDDGDNDHDDHCGGIGKGQIFFFTFKSPKGGGGGWIGDQTATASANATPEPGTLVLIATGLLPLWSLRKRVG